MNNSLTPQQINTADSIANYLWLSWFKCDLFDDNWISFAVEKDDSDNNTTYGKVLLGLFINSDGKPVIDNLSITQQTLVIDACPFIKFSKAAKVSTASIAGKVHNRAREETAKRMLGRKG